MIENVRALMCDGYRQDGSECDEVSEVWAHFESDVIKWAEKHEGWRRIDGKDYCYGCAPRWSGPLKAAGKETP
jgi:hypothetical protein